MIISCPKCGKPVKVERHPYFSEWLQGYCENCKIYVKVKLLKCRRCGKYTYHQLMKSSGNFIYYKCLECGTEKRVYVGYRKLPERSIMSTGV